MLVRFISAALAAIAAPAFAQSMPMNMPGMNMPAHPKSKAAKPAAKGIQKKPTVKAMRKSTHELAAKDHRKAKPRRSQPMTMPMNHGSMAMPSSSHSPTSTMPSMDRSKGVLGAMRMPMLSQSRTGAQGSMAMPMAHPQTGQMGAMSMDGMPHSDHEMTMRAALGPYPGQRESSGTSWQPDGSKSMTGPMVMSGDWMLMAHGTLNLVYDHQSGPRGDDKTFSSGMVMGMAEHPLGNGIVQFRAMFSPDPLMGPSGYPLLLASGETANGLDRLIDRQHPHDFFMELSASASQNIGPESSVFLYAGLPGEPAFGPPSFMHRESILDSPEAPITHHWLDSTHITFGVVTAGLVLDRVKIEASRFNGREPDQHRWDIETGPLDSSSLRVSWNPARTLALQGSWTHLVHPEQLEPIVNQTRWSASALWADDVAKGWHAAAMLAWGRKSSLGHNDDGFAAEGSIRHSDWTFFSRAEMVDNRELIQGQDEPAYRVGKVSVGGVRDFHFAKHASLGAGGSFSLNFVPSPLAPLYGGHNPTGVMGFVRLKLN